MSMASATVRVSLICVCQHGLGGDLAVVGDGDGAGRGGRFADGVLCEDESLGAIPRHVFGADLARSLVENFFGRVEAAVAVGDVKWLDFDGGVESRAGCEMISGGILLLHEPVAVVVRQGVG